MVIFMLNKHLILRLLVALPACLMGLMAFRWQTAPEMAAHILGMPLLEGVGRSTQIGDFSAFFMAIFLFCILGAVRLKPHWFSAAGILIGSAAVFRTLAFLLHGADFVFNSIFIETLFAALFLGIAFWLHKENSIPS